MDFGFGKKNPELGTEFEGIIPCTEDFDFDEKFSILVFDFEFFLLYFLTLIFFTLFFTLSFSKLLVRH